MVNMNNVYTFLSRSVLPTIVVMSLCISLHRLYHISKDKSSSDTIIGNGMQSTSKGTPPHTHKQFEKNFEYVTKAVKHFKYEYDAKTQDVMSFMQYSSIGGDNILLSDPEAWNDKSILEYIVKDLTILSGSMLYKRINFYRNNPFDYDTYTDIPIIVPCIDDDWNKLINLLEGLSIQTYIPRHTVIVLNGDNIPKPDLSKYKGKDNSEYINKDIYNIENTDIYTINDINKIKGVLYTHIKTYIDFDIYIKNGNYVIKCDRGFGPLPKLTVILRHGRHLPGSNRIYGISELNLQESETVTFFDCDDYMHPQRQEVIHNMFHMHKDLEALIHSYILIAPVHFNDIKPFYRSINFEKEMKNLTVLPYAYDTIHTHIDTLFPGKWDINKRYNEPRGWFFPDKLRPKIYPRCHQGWLSVKRDILLDIPYPQDISQGEDGLYIYRMLKSKTKFTCVDIPVGAYLHTKKSPTVLDEMRAAALKSNRTLDMYKKNIISINNIYHNLKLFNDSVVKYNNVYSPEVGKDIQDKLNIGFRSE